MSEGCIESRIAALVENKRAVFAGLFDGDSDEVVFQGQGSFLEGIKKLVEPVVVPLPAAEDIDAPAFEAPPLAETTSTQPSPDSSAQLHVEKLEDGSLRIAAPPHLAEPLAALLDQLARGLRNDTSAMA